MATEKDKTIQEIISRLMPKDGFKIIPSLDLAEAIWEAARADAIEECTKILQATADKLRKDAHRGKLNQVDEHVVWVLENAATEMRSLSRKQEEPRPSEKETDRFGKW